MDLLVRNARLLDGRVVSLGVADGLYVEVTEGEIEVEPGLAIDAEGRLVTPSFVDAHLHLDKVYTLPLAGDAALASYTSDDMGEAMRSIVRDASAVKQHYDRSWIVPNVRRALDEAVRNGVLHVQAFVDVDTTAGLEGMASVLEAREEYRDLVDLQVVAKDASLLKGRDGRSNYLMTNTVDIGPGESRDVLFHAPAPGEYLLYDRNYAYLDNGGGPGYGGMMTVIRVGAAGTYGPQSLPNT